MGASRARTSGTSNGTCRGKRPMTDVFRLFFIFFARSACRFSGRFADVSPETVRENETRFGFTKSEPRADEASDRLLRVDFYVTLPPGIKRARGDNEDKSIHRWIVRFGGKIRQREPHHVTRTSYTIRYLRYGNDVISNCFNSIYNDTILGIRPLVSV